MTAFEVAAVIAGVVIVVRGVHLQIKEYKSYRNRNRK